MQTNYINISFKNKRRQYLCRTKSSTCWGRNQINDYAFSFCLYIEDECNVLFDGSSNSSNNNNNNNNNNNILPCTFHCTYCVVDLCLPSFSKTMPILLLVHPISVYAVVERIPRFQLFCFGGYEIPDGIELYVIYALRGEK